MSAASLGAGVRAEAGASLFTGRGLGWTGGGARCAAGRGGGGREVERETLPPFGREAFGRFDGLVVAWTTLAEGAAAIGAAAAIDGTSVAAGVGRTGATGVGTAGTATAEGVAGVSAARASASIGGDAGVTESGKPLDGPSSPTAATAHATPNAAPATNHTDRFVFAARVVRCVGAAYAA